MVMMMSNSSSIAATKSITVRLSNSRSPAKVVAASTSTFFLLNGSSSVRMRSSTWSRSIVNPIVECSRAGCRCGGRAPGGAACQARGAMASPEHVRSGELQDHGTGRVFAQRHPRAAHGAARHADAVADGGPEGLDADGRQLRGVLDRGWPHFGDRARLAAG